MYLGSNAQLPSREGLAEVGDCFRKVNKLPVSVDAADAQTLGETRATQSATGCSWSLLAEYADIVLLK